MGFDFTEKIKRSWTGAQNELIKVVLLAISFFLIIAGYTIVKELKDSVFLALVGYEYLPDAKMASMFILIPMVFFYSKLVDVLRRHHLLYFYAALYGIGGFVCAYFLAHPSVGLQNVVASKGRVFGWIFYFFFEGYSPFVVSVLWAFLNSISGPEEVKNNYVIMTASSKLGGVAGAGFAWWLLGTCACGTGAIFSEISAHWILLTVASAMLLLVPLFIHFLTHRVASSSMHGYEAAYRAAKDQAEEDKKQVKGGLGATLWSMFSGFILLVRYPYMMGIFGMIFFWEIVNVIFNFMRLGVGQAENDSLAGFSAFLYKQAFFTHLVGVIFVLVGTRLFVTWLGERRSLMLIPVLTGAVLCGYLMFQTSAAVTLAYIIIRAINYAFAYPLRESLYIPTTKEMKFKSKSWIDGFGSKFSKTCGSSYNKFIHLVPLEALFSVNLGFFAAVIGLWTLMAHFLGKRFEYAIAHNEVIGVDDPVEARFKKVHSASDIL